MTKEIAVVDQVVAKIRSDAFRHEIQATGTANADRTVRVTVTAVRENPEILTADRGSLYAAVIKCAQDGLVPDGREASLVVFGHEVVYLPMVGGYRKIAAEHDWLLNSHVVYAADVFEYELGLTEKLEHVPAKLGADRGPALGAYAVARHTDGRTMVEVMDDRAIEKVRQMSRWKNAGPWKDWPERMWEKTVVRRLFAKLPLGDRDSERVSRMLKVDEVLEATAVRVPNDPGPDDSLPEPPPLSQGGQTATTDQSESGTGGGSESDPQAVFRIPETVRQELGE